MDIGTDASHGTLYLNIGLQNSVSIENYAGYYNWCINRHTTEVSCYSSQVY